MNNGGARPSRGNAFMLFLLLFNIILTLAIGLTFLALRETPYTAFFFTPWFTIAGQIFGLLLPLGLWLCLTREHPGAFLPRMKLGGVNIVLIIVLCFCMLPAVGLLSALSALVFPNNVAETLDATRSWPFITSILVFAVAPALCEEFVFRGYLLSRFQSLDTGRAAFVCGLFFAVIHLDAQQFLYAFVMGAVFVYFVRYTRSIRAGVLAHFCINAMPFVIDAVLGVLFPEAIADTGTGELWQAALYQAAVALIFLPAVILLFRAFISHNRLRGVRHDIWEALRTVEHAPNANAAPIEKTPVDNESNRVFDPLFWGVVGTYVLFMFVTR